jgi:hypothetical protein
LEDKYVEKDRVFIKLIPKQTAKTMIVNNHYSRKWTLCKYALGIFYRTDNEHAFFDEKEEKLVGVAVYGGPIGRLAAQSISEELNQNQVLELTRLFIFDGYGKNIESLALGLTFKWLKENDSTIKALISYSDPKVNHKGTIYQATNWLYQGNKTKILDSRQFKFKKDGDWVHSRTVNEIYGTNKIDDLTPKVGHTYWWRIEPHKHRYVYILADKSEKRRIMKTLKHPPIPYIKELEDENMQVFEVKVEDTFYG